MTKLVNFCLLKNNLFLSAHKTLRQSLSIKQENFKLVTPLNHRAIIQIDGQQSIEFLQGLLTNDVTLLAKQKSMYAMMLNRNGRVLHDVLLYRSMSTTGSEILLECQSEDTESILKALKAYKLRKKVSFSPKQDYKLYQVHLDSRLKDPRLTWLGWRVIATSQPCTDDLLGEPDGYHMLRYKLGIPEGSTDLPPGRCFPLEANIEFMNGISFNKGCYIGQELTARTHYTGVIRKRLMPFSILNHKDLSKDTKLFDSKGKSVGKVLATLCGTVGLALIRLDSQCKVLNTINGATVVPGKTAWWPPLE
ncbi:iron-sulfur cluster assembly factor IBA57, mitochondrial-like [Clavelina lepadiformis]|uniref:iron-sulfur cluster assembly factor IBA57, mitochondrial-like n=1 Tax=Clavelina lepadiformis TaxID=159417 RepID=UPI00404387A9